MTTLQKRFEQFILEQQLCQPDRHRLLVGVSGGKDSMLLLHLLAQAGYQVGVAHCNFGLRGAESDLDETFVRDQAAQLKLPFYLKRFDTTAYAAEKGISIQMAARDLRYAWFEEQRQEQGFDFIAVAHHATDNVETILINQLRGTGIRGLTGMQAFTDRLIRPLLFLRAEEIASAVAALGLPFRDDQSNFSTDYTRNKIRLEVLPPLKEINPDLEDTFARNSKALQEVQEFLDEQVADLRSRYLVENGDMVTLAIEPILQFRSYRLLLYELLRPYGFSSAVVSDLAERLNASGSTQSGLQFYSSTHHLLLDRNNLLIRPIQGGTNPSYPGEQHQFKVEIQAISEWSETQPLEEKRANDPNMAYFDADRVTLPLKIRPWKEGDVFRPFGMGGKHKKLSDFFIGLKLTRWQKAEVPVVVDAAGTIIWVVPYRVSSDYNICDRTQNVMVISYFCQNG